MKLRAIAVIFFLASQLLACVYHETLPKIPGTQVVNKVGVNPNVYLAGTVGAAAVLWKNGIADTLDQGGVTSLFVDGADVYAAGWKSHTIIINNIPQHIAMASYWKNGVPVVLSDTTSNSYVHSIFVVNDHVYAVGHEESIALPSMTSYAYNAKCWKDGMPMPLSTQGAVDSEANGIYVSGTDIYVAGSMNKPNSRMLATYWKNGVPVYLTDGTQGCTAKSIFVSGNDVYVAGTVNFQYYLGVTGGFVLFPQAKCIATYWKNGKPVPLSTKGSYASSIFVNGTDVYVAGTIVSEAAATVSTPITDGAPNVATYWKNGVQINLNNDNQYSIANSISVTEDGDVYLAGMINHQAVNWLNGSRTYFTNPKPLAINSSMNAVFLTN